LIKGEGFIFRNIVEEDYKRIYEWFQDEEIRYYYSIRNTLVGYKQIEERLNHLDYNKNKEFMIELENGITIGKCALNSIDWINSNCELEILIGQKDYWSKGYGKKVIRKLVEYAFYNLNLYCVHLKVHSFNERGIKCYEKCGFEQEGVLRNRLYRDGKYYNQIIMSILNDQLNK
jgi:RimJ/RimL family protein N-acetyltransferase